MIARWLTLFVSIAFAISLGIGSEGEERENSKNDAPVKNTQEETTPFLTPEDALAKIKLPKGLAASVFAHEPDVQQPIAMAFDHRGRMWVAENYTYAEREVNYDLSQHDRVIILEDADRDGKAEKRTVFWDQGQRLTSVEVGFGGVFVLCPPFLMFIPDRNGDDIPDGEPEILLDGWNDNAARHNFVNGLRFGPDGWLYGRNGILATSWVGSPGTPMSERTPINCGVWRYHLATQKFEVVCTGTTNPWGMDWDEHGQLFFINTVIGHLFHVIPGAHFRRMYGEDLNPYAYELIEQTADHFHWDADHEQWTAQRTALTPASSLKGGGHAHSGLMIYLGGLLPEQYRGDIFAVNLHGHRINRDHPKRTGATYVATHRPDFMITTDEWFRGIDLAYGPDGYIYVLDWSDIGECHENDGVHRSSGRIYRIGPDEADATRILPFDLAGTTDQELLKAQVHPNEWFARRARLELQYRALRKELGSSTPAALTILPQAQLSVQERLRFLWVENAIGTLTEKRLTELLTDPDEQIRSWAIRFLVDQRIPSDEAVASLSKMGAKESSGLVLTYMASALGRLPAEQRWEIAEHIIQHDEFAGDRVLPLMVWYGVEPAVPAHPDLASQLAMKSRMPQVTKHISRRLTDLLTGQPQVLDLLVAELAKSESSALVEASLTGMNEGLRGARKAPMPTGWNVLVEKFHEKFKDSPAISPLVQELSVVFGDGRAIEDVRKIAQDGGQTPDSRRKAIQTLVQARTEGLPDLLLPLLTDRELGQAAVRGLSELALVDNAQKFVETYTKMYPPAKSEVVSGLASRKDTALILLAAVESDVIRRHEVPPATLRQLQLMNEPTISEKMTKLWPNARLIAEEKVKLIANYRENLENPEAGSADLSKGKKLFMEHCGKCHKLFGEGGTIAPELTGSQRTNLNYLLENIIDPSAEVATSFRISVLELKDGRTLNGVVLNSTERAHVVQTVEEKLTIEKAQVLEMVPSKLSLMPDGLLNNLQQEQVRDLFGYLMSPGKPATE